MYPYRIVYDFEAMFKSIDKKSARTKYYAEHVPLSVSIHSNVPEFSTPKCIVSTGDPQQLIDEMGEYMEKIAAAAFENLKSVDFKAAYEEIDSSRNPESLKKILDRYLQVVPCVGFNSGKYDVNMIKPYFVHRFVIPFENSSEVHVIKRGNDFMSVTTPSFNFLDIKNFIAPGYSLSKYLSAMKIKEKKGFFPYEYIDSLEKLEETKLPAKTFL